MKTAVVLCLLLLSLGASAWDDDDERRWRQLNLELRCLVCQNQSIADSHAPLAEDLRAQVRQMIEAGRSDNEIRHYMTERYGDFVLYRPPFKPTTWLLWLGPALMLGVAVLVVARIRRRPTSKPVAGNDEAAVQALLKEVERE